MSEFHLVENGCSYRGIDGYVRLVQRVAANLGGDRDGAGADRLVATAIGVYGDFYGVEGAGRYAEVPRKLLGAGCAGRGAVGGEGAVRVGAGVAGPVGGSDAEALSASDSGIASGGSAPGLVRGRHYKKNLRKRQKAAGRSAAANWRESPVVDDPVVSEKTGFWESCSAGVRQRLIDSKAEMHIAENKRRAREAEERVAYLESPEAMLTKAMRMVDMANRCAKQKNDHKVAGWAQTVATSYAESIARSSGSSVKYSSGVSTASGSVSGISVSGEIRKKPVESFETAMKRIESMATVDGCEGFLERLQRERPYEHQQMYLLVQAANIRRSRLNIGC